MLFLKVLQPRIVERYPTGLECDDVEQLEGKEGEPFTIREKGVIVEEKMMENEAGPLDQKHSREAGYKADDEDSDAKSYPNLKKPRRYLIVSETEDEPDEPEDDKIRDFNYNPFRIPKGPRKRLCNAY